MLLREHPQRSRCKTYGDLLRWTAELLADDPSWKRPAPFTESEHTFGSLEEARQWLGNPEIRDTGQMG